jgi:lactam utilization protein B
MSLRSIARRAYKRNRSMTSRLFAGAFMHTYAEAKSKARQEQRKQENKEQKTGGK